MTNLLTQLKKRVKKELTHEHKWEVIRTIWPYEDGWGTWCPGCLMILDTGLEKELAEARRDALNE